MTKRGADPDPSKVYTSVTSLGKIIQPAEEANLFRTEINTNHISIISKYSKNMKGNI
jgi:hypothetical protein